MKTQSKIIRDILHQKEKNGLWMQNIARLVVIFFYLPVSIVLAQSYFEQFFSTIIMIVSLCLTSLSLLLIKKEKNLTLIGITGAIFDVFLVLSLTIIWYQTVGGPAVPASFMLKNMVTVTSAFFIVLNGQSMKPLYPLIVGTGTSLMHIGIFIYAASWPGAEYAQNYYEAFFTVKLSLPALFTQATLLFAIGGFTAWLNYNAQKSVVSAAELERVNNQLGRFFSPNVAETISAGDDDFTHIGGRVQNIAVLFTDIRNFTSLSSNLPPDEVLGFLSEYHRVMVAIIFRHGGTLDKFIGDAIMATFGTPNTGKDDVLRAVRAAIDMEKELKYFNEERDAKGLFTISHGIGIHYGPALVGNIGTPERLEYTVIGDTVNVASRIESSCKDTGETLLFSDSVNSELLGLIETRKVGEIKVKGKMEPLVLYTIA